MINTTTVARSVVAAPHAIRNVLSFYHTIFRKVSLKKYRTVSLCLPCQNDFVFIFVMTVPSLVVFQKLPGKRYEMFLKKKLGVMMSIRQ